MAELTREEKLSLATEQLRGLIDFARDVLKSVTLINGGAAIALLAFAGSVLSTENSKPNLDTNLMTCAIGVFTFGVFLAAIAATFGYFTQYKYFQESIGIVPVGAPRCWHIAALFFVVLSLLAFFAGVLLSLVAFSR